MCERAWGFLVYKVKEEVYLADANLTQVTARATALHEFVLGVLFQI